MTIQRTDTEILITLPASINIDGLQRLLDYLLYKEATKDSQAKQEDVDVLAREVNKEWWANNNHRWFS
jgi:adenosine deaminase